jgi:hypothetical protein
VVDQLGGAGGSAEAESVEAFLPRFAGVCGTEDQLLSEVVYGGGSDQHGRVGDAEVMQDALDRSRASLRIVRFRPANRRAALPARTAARPSSSGARPAQARSASASLPRPGMFAPRGEKEPYKAIQALENGSPAALIAARCERIAATHPSQRIAALTLAGLLALGQDQDMAIRNLGQVLMSGTEIAKDRLLRHYSPIRSLSIRAVNPAATVPLSRDLVAMLLVQLHTAAGQLDWAESAATQLRDSLVANALHLQLAIRRQQDPTAQPRW